MSPNISPPDLAEQIKSDLRQPWLKSAKIFGGKSCSITSIGEYYWTWQAGKGGTYSRQQPDGSATIAIPQSLRSLAIAIATESADCPQYNPQIALINVYKGKQKLNLHQDIDERCDAPVISLSFNTSGIFTFDRNGKRERVQLDDRDVFIFGGTDRYMKHGYEGNLDPTSTRMNITIRQYC
ncbi:alpha-ketoglutarate-dependent dioxygenase AlkB [Chamaesiphon sp.]|uniref:alpha-ketoglutarate-dependent dioxygenase AlkB n=1 Tax=Chamaesiphon sp. TaxID=2814140 RepID=UPI0035943823